MQRPWFQTALLAALVLGGGAQARGQQQSDAAPSKGVRIVEIIDGDGETKGNAARRAAVLGLATEGDTLLVNRPDEPPFYIGVNCSPADEALRTQLGLGDKAGLVVDAIVPDSPAAKAGLKKFDVIHRVGNDRQAVGEVETLTKAVQAAGENSLKLEIIRGGKTETVKVTPAKREKGRRAEIKDLDLDGDVDIVLRWFADADDQGLRLHGLRRGLLLNNKLGTADLPINMSISISKSGDQPAKIAVERDGKKWEVTEDKLSELPDDVRKTAESFLDQSSGRGDLHGLIVGKAGGEAGDPAARMETFKKLIEGKAKSRWAAEERSDDQLKAINDRLDQLQKALEELRRDREPKK